MSKSTPLQLLRRSVGSWTSQRRYLFAPKMAPSNLVTNFVISDDPDRGNIFVIDWEGQTRGQMVLTLEEDLLHRSRDYFSDGEAGHSSKVSAIDLDTLLLETEYGGNRYREEIRLLLSDTVRLRQTIGTSIENGRVTLVGQYFEIRTP